jgi:hypothetical protein
MSPAHAEIFLFQFLSTGQRTEIFLLNLLSWQDTFFLPTEPPILSSQDWAYLQLPNNTFFLFKDKPFT